MNINTTDNTVDIDTDHPVDIVKLGMDIHGVELGLESNGTYCLAALTKEGILLHKWLPQSLCHAQSEVVTFNRDVYCNYVV